MSDERQAFTDLLRSLLKATSSDHRRAPGGGDRDAAVRLLAHALLNASQTLGDELFENLRQVLPWLEAARLDDPDDRIRHLAEHPGVAVLNADILRRNGGGQSTSSLARLIALEQRLIEVAGANDPDDLRSALLADTRLLSAAIAIRSDNRGDDAHSAPNRIASAVSTDHLHDAQTGSNARALDVLASLEAGDPEILGDTDQLADRAYRFEQSLVANASDHGLIEVIRAALAFGTEPLRSGHRDDSGDAAADALYDFELFRRRPALASLARGLIAMRGMIPAYMRGAVPLRALSPWVEYLRGASSNFADARDIAPKEAMSWAHFCLHSMNICDLVAREDELTDSIRSSLKDIEDELKEFAMTARRDGGTRQPDGSMNNLGRYERMRWRPRGDVEYLADRMARLAGGWRAPTRRTPVGSPADMTSPLAEQAGSLLESALSNDRVSDDRADHVARRFAEATQHCRIRQTDWLEDVDLEMIARLLAFGYRCARDLPGVSVGSGFELDLGDLRPTDGDAADLQALEALLSRHSLAQLLSDDARPPDHTLGLVGALHTSGDGPPTVQLQLELNGELRALLQLVEEQTGQGDRPADPELKAHIDRRIDELLEGPSDVEVPQPEHRSDPRSTADRSTA